MKQVKDFNKTLCILANSKVGDMYGKKIVNQLKTRYGLNDIKLLGNGGEHLENHGLKSFINLDDMREKVLYLWRYHQKSILSMKFSKLHFYQHVMLRMNYNLLGLMKENDVFANIARARPSCIISLDNEHMSMEIMKNVNNHYNHKFPYSDRLRRPDTYMLTNTIHLWDENYKSVCDFAFYNLAQKQITRRHFIFPGHYIGQYGSYEALRHLWKKTKPQFLLEESILLSRDYSLDDIEQSRKIVSKEFREKNLIEEDDTVVFFAPGNTILENEYSLETFRLGYNQFVLKNSYPTSLSHYAPSKNHFRLIISIQKGTSSEEYIRKFLKESQFETEFIIVTDEENYHFDAICASNFGIVYNGQMVSTAAALHLNTATMQNMNDLHYYWHTWENRWLADINVNADRPVIKELACGEYWYGKICELLSTMHVKTDKGIDQIRELKPFVLETLPYKEIDRTKYSDSRDLIINNEIYDEYENPIDIMSNRIFNSMKSYNNSFNSVPDIDYLSKRIPSFKESNSIL